MLLQNVLYREGQVDVPVRAMARISDCEDDVWDAIVFVCVFVGGLREGKDAFYRMNVIVCFW